MVGNIIDNTANVNLGNLTSKGKNEVFNIITSNKNTVISWGIPDYTSGISRNYNTNYTASNNGFVSVFSSCYAGSTNVYMQVNNVSFRIAQTTSSGHLGTSYALIPVKKGDSWRVNATLNSDSNTFVEVKFYKAVGG